MNTPENDFNPGHSETQLSGTDRSKLEGMLEVQKKELSSLENQADDAGLPSGAYWRLDKLRESIARLEEQLYVQTNIFEVMPDEFLEHFANYFKNYLKDPFSEESARFKGLVKLVEGNPELFPKLEQIPEYIAYKNSAQL